MSDLLRTLGAQAVSLGWVQWASFLTGLAYIILAARNNPSCWPWGILSSGLWAWASWFQLHLLSDALLQVFYVVLGFVGWYHWAAAKGTQNSKVLAVSSLKSKELVYWILASAGLSLILGLVMQPTTAAFPFTDAALTVYSVSATLMLVKRKMENWIFWIVIDLVSIPVFIMRGGYLFALLFFIYTLIAWRGWKNWQSAIARAGKTA